MNRRTFGAIAALIFVTGAPAGAGTRDGRFAIEEAGQPICSKYLQARDAKSPAYGIMVAFIEGYLTAANRYEPDTFDLTPWHTTTALSIIVDDYCSKYPKEELAIVAQKLTIAFKANRLQEFSPIVEVRNGTSKAVVYRAVLERMEAALAQKGLYSGPATGEYSPQLQAALLAFQKSRHLTLSGVPDAATAWNLLEP